MCAAPLGKTFYIREILALRLPAEPLVKAAVQNVRPGIFDCPDTLFGIEPAMPFFEIKRRAVEAPCAFPPMRRYIVSGS